MKQNRANKEVQPTNYRKNRRQRERMLLLLVLFVLVGIGTGLIGLIWGANSAFLGGICLLGGGTLIVGLWFLLSLLEKLVGN